MKGSQHILLILLSTIALLELLPSCHTRKSTFTPEERREADSIVRQAKSLEELESLQRRFDKEGHRLASIIALREWGKRLRNESRFDEALLIHSKASDAAQDLQDTLEWVRALNDVGTDYRRIGALDVAQQYHYQAWLMSQEHSDTTSQAKKNQVVALNGLGNIYMTLGNYRRADSALRMALAGEIALGSAVGQAINYANLGAIFEHRGMLDSAWHYYRLSMQFNEQDHNTLGISLCHTYFGSLYEKAEDYEHAIAEYQKAYELMSSSKDDWHALTSLLALSGIYLRLGREEQLLPLLERSASIARRIKSREHLAEVYSLYYKYYKKQDDYISALYYQELATGLRDSIVGIEQVNRIQNTGISIERSRQARQMDEVRLRLEHEQATRHVSYAIFILILVLLILLIGTLLYIQRVRTRSHQALKQMSQMREHFFTNITHEFRTPLTVILGLSQDLRRDPNNSHKVHEQADTIQRQGNSLLTLINQLLDISKIRSAIGIPDMRHGDIRAYVGALLESYRDYAESRHIYLLYKGDDPIVIDFVPSYINKIVINLLSNAFKFTPAYGTIQVTLEQAEGILHLEVSDTGSGISPEALPHIFAPFYQAQDENASGGSGIGLALVKQIVDTLEGEVSVTSTLGEGTKIHIALPIQEYKGTKSLIGGEHLPCDLPLISQIKEPSEPVALAGTRILIVEDHRDIASYMGSLLSAHGYEVYYEPDGHKGLERAKELVPDLIISDLMMPQLDGLEMTRLIRTNEVISHIPIIMVTAKVTEEDRLRGLQAGVDAYLTKPFSSEELCLRVEKLLERQRHLQYHYMRHLAEGMKTLDKGTIAQTDDEVPPPDRGGASAHDGEPTLTDHTETKHSAKTYPETEPSEGEDPAVLLSPIDQAFVTRATEAILLALEKYQAVEVSSLAKTLCMSPSQLYRKMTAVTGHTPINYIQHVKVKKACQLLVEQPSMCLAEVAERSGFNDYSNFLRTFKSLCGVPPSRYARERDSLTRRRSDPS